MGPRGLPALGTHRRPHRLPYVNFASCTRFDTLKAFVRLFIFLGGKIVQQILEIKSRNVTLQFS